MLAGAYGGNTSITQDIHVGGSEPFERRFPSKERYTLEATNPADVVGPTRRVP